MRKLYFLIMLVSLLLANNKILSQCQTIIRTVHESVCSNSIYTYRPIGLGYDSLTYTWSRAFVAGINNSPGIGTGTTSTNPATVITEALNNTTSQSIVVTYIVTLVTTIKIDPSFPSFKCTIIDSVKVTVNPLPIINPIGNKFYCNGDFVNAMIFRSESLNPSFTWELSGTIGLSPTKGQGIIPAFTALNSGTTALTAYVTVSISNNSICPKGVDSLFTITVYPSPPKPNFTSLSGTPDSAILVLCGGSENINFNVNSPVQDFAYRWASPTRGMSIRDTTHANTVISFFDTANAYPTNIILTAKSSKGCSSSASQLVRVIPSGSVRTDKRKIFLMQPGNLLIYPDNSLTAYQWGYDTIVYNTASDLSYSRPVPIEGQVYQFFSPDSRFTDPLTNLLNENKYFYWVLLRNGNCLTKIYYNGPYANRVIEIPPADSTVQLKIVPNPNKGAFKIALKGNIYGNIHAEIYNSMGRVVFSKDFKKITADINEQMNSSNLPAGLYLLVLYSSDLKKISSRFVIQH